MKQTHIQRKFASLILIVLFAITACAPSLSWSDDGNDTQDIVETALVGADWEPKQQGKATPILDTPIPAHEKKKERPVPRRGLWSVQSLGEEDS